MLSYLLRSLSRYTNHLCSGEYPRCYGYRTHCTVQRLVPCIRRGYISHRRYCPQDLEIESLVERVPREQIKEVILAISPTMEGETTNFYIYKRLAPLEVHVSLLSRGIAMGDELEYTDEVTLARALRDRSDFTQSFR